MSDSTWELTRRTFLQLGAAGALAGIEKRIPFTHASHRLRVGLLGYGGRGEAWLDQFRRTSEVELAGIADVDHKALRRATEHGMSMGLLPTTHWGDDSFFEDASIDAVVIAAPANRAIELALLACKRQRHVFVDGTLQADSVALRRLATSATARQLTVSAGTPALASTYVEDAVKAVRAGMVGRPHTCRVEAVVPAVSCNGIPLTLANEILIALEGLDAEAPVEIDLDSRQIQGGTAFVTCCRFSEDQLLQFEVRECAHNEAPATSIEFFGNGGRYKVHSTGDLSVARFGDASVTEWTAFVRRIRGETVTSREADLHRSIVATAFTNLASSSYQRVCLT